MTDMSLGRRVESFEQRTEQCQAKLVSIILAISYNYVCSVRQIDDRAKAIIHKTQR